jgi:hypothetical protein
MTSTASKGNVTFCHRHVNALEGEFGVLSPSITAVEKITSPELDMVVVVVLEVMPPLE